MMSIEWYPWLRSWKPWQICLLTFAIVGLGPAAVSVFEGTCCAPKGEVLFPFFGRFIVWPVTFLVIVPLMAGVVVMYRRGVTEALTRALEEGVIEFKYGDTSPLKTIARIVNSPVKLSLIAVVAAYGVWTYLTLNKGGVTMLEYTVNDIRTWARGDYFLPYFENAGVSLVFFSVCVSAVATLFIILNGVVDFVLWIVLLFALGNDENDSKIMPILFHPDSAAGLALFGRTIWQFYLFTFLICMITTFQVGEKFLAHPDLTLDQILAKYPAVSIVIYVIAVLLPVVFGIALVPLRARLVKFRKRSLRLLAQQHHERLISLNRLALTEEGIVEFPEQVDEIEKLKRAYECIDAIPQWPFEPGVLTKFGATYLIPVGGVLFELASRFSDT